jgi:hypothetical protein
MVLFNEFNDFVGLEKIRDTEKLYYNGILTAAACK